MRRLLLPLLLVAGAAAAEAPETAPRPQARPEAEPPGRPAPRPEVVGLAEAIATEVPRGPEDRPAAALEIVVEGASPAGPAAPPEPPSAALAEVPGLDHLPAVPRDPPVIETEPPEPDLAGPAGVVRAELLMSELPPLRVVVDGWAGDAPPARPGAEPLPGDPVPPLRPRARPLPPQDPQPLLPPEPDAPPAYAPAARPDILPVGPGYSPLAVAVAVLPQARPPGIVERAEAARAEAVRGQVCGNPGIQGEVVAAIHGSGGCGIEEPVRVRSVDGVRLSEGALMDCATAEALLEWVQEGARPAVGSRGGGLAGLDLMGHYVCRPRNNQAGARMSEHGLGRAVDIGAVLLADGSRISVARDWPDPALRQMHEAACGIFSTTLGPGSDGFHEDHLHYDTARGRGPYCR